MGFPSFPFDEVSADSKRLLQQQLPPLVAFPCLLMGLLGLFFALLGVFSQQEGAPRFVSCPLLAPVREVPGLDKMLPIISGS